MTQTSATFTAAAPWSPPAGLVEHSGVAIPADAFFPEPPPAEIGAITSAETTLSTLKKPRSTGFRMMLAAISAAIIVAFTFYAVHTDLLNSSSLVYGLLIAVVFGFFIFIGTAPRRQCSYVGQLAARFTLRSNKPPKVQQILFEQAAELRTGITHNYHNGIYNGTTYFFTWTDANGKRVLHITGSHRSKNKSPKRLNPYHFPHAAEIQWSGFLLERAADELAQSGVITFHISKGKTVRLAPASVEFHWGADVARLEAPDIAQISLSQGQFMIKSKDAKWFSSKGKFSFAYSQMPNARVFLLALQRFLPNVPKSF